MMTFKAIAVAVALMFPASIAFGADADFNGNPAAPSKPRDGEIVRAVNVPGATGVNPYSGRSVGTPLQSNDLGSPKQAEKERNLCQTERCKRLGY